MTQEPSNSIGKGIKISLRNIWNFLLCYYLPIFIVFIFLLDLLYPITITFDSAHYLWLADIIKNGDWATWDIIRNVIFPFHIYFSFSFWGDNQIGLLIPAIFAHIALFYVSCMIAFFVIRPKQENSRFFISLIIFIFIALDPTIFGYFHTILTEYLVALIAMLSCFMALKLTNTQPYSKLFFLYSFYFAIMIPITWHIKQPFIGAAFFPFCISIFVLLFKKFSWKELVYGVLIIISILVITLATSFAWESFLISQGNPMMDDRHVRSFAEREIDRALEQFQTAPFQFVKRKMKHYLETINFFIGLSAGKGRNPSLLKANENTVIAHRMYFHYGENNYLHHNRNYTNNLRGRYTPPIWLNNYFLSRVTNSNFLFTISYLILPILLIIVFLVWIQTKNVFATGTLILGGTSYLNAMIHLFTHPIDRYLFIGYPLNLLVILVLLIKAFQKYSTAM